MSRTLERLRRKESTAMMQIRSADGKTQGPFSIQTLCEQAAQNRIPQGAELSADGITWVPAESVPDLRLEWTAADSMGRACGPFNLQAAPLLIAEGALSKDAVLTNRLTGQTISAGEVLRLSEEHKTTPQKKKYRPAAPAAESRPAPARLDENDHAELLYAVEDLTSRLQRSEQRFHDATREMEQSSAKYRALQEDTRRQRAETNAQIHRLEDRLHQMAGDLAKSEAALRRQQTEHEKLQREFVERETKLKERAELLTAQIEEERQAHARTTAISLRQAQELDDRSLRLAGEAKDTASLLHQARLVAEREKELRESISAQNQEKESLLIRQVSELQNSLQNAQQSRADAVASLQQQVAVLEKDLETSNKLIQESRLRDAGNQEAADRERITERKELENLTASLERESRRLASELAAAKQEAPNSLRLFDEARNGLQEERKKLEHFQQQGSRKRESDLHRQEAARISTPAFSRTRLLFAGLALIAVTAACAFVAGRLTGPAEPAAVPEDEFYARRDVAGTQRTDAPSAAEPISTITEEPETPAVIASEAPPVLTWPRINVRNVRTTVRNGVCTVVFENGIFSLLATLDDNGARALSQTVACLQGRLNDFSIIVEGHTDSMAMSSGAPYANNYELGLARARTVVDFLRTECGVPANALTATSAGESNPPFPNDTPESRARNRTAVLKLVPTQPIPE